MSDSYIIYRKSDGVVLNKIVYNGNEPLDLPKDMVLEEIDFSEQVSPNDIRISKGKYQKVETLSLPTEAEFVSLIEEKVKELIAKQNEA